MPKRALCLFKEWALCNVLLRKGLGTTLKATWAVSFSLLLIIKPFPKRDVLLLREAGSDKLSGRNAEHMDTCLTQKQGWTTDPTTAIYQELRQKEPYPTRTLTNSWSTSWGHQRNHLCLSEYLVSEVLQCLFMTKAGFVCHLRSFRLIWRGWEAVS